MGTSEFGNISWIYFVVGAYGIVLISLLAFTVSSRRRYSKAQEALKEEGFSADKTW